MSEPDWRDERDRTPPEAQAGPLWTRLRAAPARLPAEQRLAGAAAIGIVLSMFLPWWRDPVFGLSYMAFNRFGWIEFASSVLNDIAGLYNAADPAAFAAKRVALRAKFERLEDRLVGAAFFDGPDFSCVDAAFAPVFRYWDVFDEIAAFGSFDGLGKVQAWRATLAQRASVRLAAAPDYAQRLHAFLRARPYFSTNARSIT